MKRTILYIYITAALGAAGCRPSADAELSVLQLNIWMQCTQVPGAAEGLTEVIAELNPDVVLLCELTADATPSFAEWLVGELQRKGLTYHSDGEHAGVGLLSKYKPDSTRLLTVSGGDRTHAILKACFTAHGLPMAVYSAHLDHRHYGPYIPRGRSAADCSPLAQPVPDLHSILSANRLALREEAIQLFLDDARAARAAGHFVLLGGDLNEPSHLDWQANTAHLRDHNGILPWDCSLLLRAGGYTDAYRHHFPDAASHPGFTWPAGNTSAELTRLYSVPESDERDRIDFIYYAPHPSVKLTRASIVGPAASVDHGAIVPDLPADCIRTPRAVWPSDHKGNLVRFTVGK
jgi:endonuclease/exonuclease/phosphatase family metal-dependent hydrolase